MTTVPEEALPEGRGHRMLTQPDYYNADFSNIRYTYPNEENMIHMCHHDTSYGVGSSVEQGFINVASQLDSLIDEPPL